MTRGSRQQMISQLDFIILGYTHCNWKLKNNKNTVRGNKKMPKLEIAHQCLIVQSC